MIYCNGFDSCINSTLSPFNESDCLGTTACLYSSIISNQISRPAVCSGYGACTLATQLHGGVSTDCYGSHSCMANGNISLQSPSSGHIACYGYHSCAHSTILLNSSYDNTTLTNGRTISIYGGGTFSLYDTTIYSNYNNINVYLYGYNAGYGLTLYCQYEDNCAVSCYGNACHNTTLVCNNNGNICTSSCKSDDSDCEIASANFTFDSLMYELNDKIMAIANSNSGSGGSVSIINNNNSILPINLTNVLEMFDIGIILIITKIIFVVDYKHLIIRLQH